MDKIFFNGCIRTLDDQNTVAQAVGIENGKITFIGTGQEAERIFCEDRTDLQGRLLLPGFVDTHLHMLHYAFVEKSVKLFDCRSVEEMLDTAKKKLDESAGKQLTWLYCRGWNEEHFETPRYPLKEELDALSTEIPIIMVRVCGHVAVCNSCGLERLKKIEQFDEIAKEVDFQTGLLKENAVQFYSSVLEAPSQEEVEGYITYSAKKLNECGFTGVQSDDLASLPGKNWRRIMDSYQALDARGELNIRHYEQCLFERAEDAKAFIEEGFRTGQRGNHFTIGPMKLLQDGSLGARTAAMNEPYTDDPQNRGIITFTQEELDDLFAFFDQHQMQAAVHCIGDRAMDMVIEAVEKSPYREKNPKNRHGIVHCQITNQRILEAMKQQDILAYIQPVFIDLDMNTVEPAIGSERMDKIYAWKSMLDLGIHTSGGSDAPVVSFDAMENIYFAVTRRNIQGQPEEGWIPSEKMSVDEAVKLFTKNAAYASYTEDENGTIEVGKNADFVVLERDIYQIDPEEIKTTKVDLTILGGKPVYERKTAERAL
nr:amidohydrolase [uncultured Mediterraneibacter sp.]